MFFVIDNCQHPPQVLFSSACPVMTLKALNKSKFFTNRTIHELTEKESRHLPLKPVRFEVVGKAHDKTAEVVYDGTLEQCIAWVKRDADEHYTYNAEGTGDGKTYYFQSAWNVADKPYIWTVRPCEYAYCEEKLNNA